ncbi:MAG: 6-phosphogluconolactonase [Cyclobacteriaceae bacterium]
MNKHIYESPAEVAENFAQFFLNLTKGNEEFHVALSGGSTPKILFDFISQNLASEFDWSKIHLWWGDERCVPPTDSDSNYKMTKERLIDHISIPESNVHRVLGENTPKEEAMRYAEEIEKAIPSQNSLPQFDLILLGMGDDGHTASIFPHEIELLNSKQTCDVAVHPESGQNRITITGDTLNNASNIVFLVTGANKKEKIQSIFTKVGGYLDYPAAHIKPSEGNLFWFMDKAAWGNS